MLIAVLDSRPLALEGISRILETFNGVERVDRMLSPMHALAEALNEPYACLVVRLPRSDSSDSYALLRSIRRVAPELPVAVIVDEPDPGVTMRLLRAGVRAVLSLLSTPEEFARAIRAVSAGKYFVPGASAEEAIRYLHDRAQESDFSDRARQALGLAARGLSTREIAAEMSVGLSTAKRLLREAYEHVGTTARSDAIRVARQRGLVDAE